MEKVKDVISNREKEIEKAIKSFGLQNVPCGIETFITGVKWADKHPSNVMLENVKKSIIQKVCEWLIENMYDYYNGDIEFAIASGFVKRDEFIENFIKAMEK